jgi:hypothetical protein
MTEIDTTVVEVTSYSNIDSREVENGTRPLEDFVEALLLDASTHQPASAVRTNSSTYHRPQHPRVDAVGPGLAGGSGRTTPRDLAIIFRAATANGASGARLARR